MSHDKKFLVKGTIVNLLGTLAKIISPALTLLLARIFTLEEFGLFISIQYFTMTFSKLSVLGLDKGLIWFIPRNQKREREKQLGIVESLYFGIITSSICYIIFSLFLYTGGLKFFPNLITITPLFFGICLFSTLPLAGLHIFSSSLEGIRLPEYKIFINQFFVTSLFPLLAIAIKFLGFGENSLPLGFTISNLIGFFIYIFLLRRYFKGLKWFSFKFPPKELFTYSLPLGIAEILSGILLRVDLWMIVALMGPKNAAIYSIMVLLANGLRTIRQGFDPLIVPIVSKMNRGQVQRELKSIFSYATNMVTSIQILIITFLIFFPNETLSLAGKSYAVEARALAILLIGNLINGFFGLNGVVLLGLGKSKTVMFTNISILIFNIGLNSILIPKYGITGAALGTTISFLLQNLVYYISQFKITSLNLYQPYLLINLFTILGIAFLVGNLYQNILEQSFLQRLEWFGYGLLVLSILFLINRKHYKING